MSNFLHFHAQAIRVVVVVAPFYFLRSKFKVIHGNNYEPTSQTQSVSTEIRNPDEGVPFASYLRLWNPVSIARIACPGSWARFAQLKRTSGPTVNLFWVRCKHLRDNGLSSQINTGSQAPHEKKGVYKQWKCDFSPLLRYMPLMYKWFFFIFFIFFKRYNRLRVYQQCVHPWTSVNQC